MKKQRIPISFDKQKMILHLIVGLFIGFFVLHPVTMVIYWFEFNPSEINLSSFIEVFITRLRHSFNPKMFSMGLIFAFLGGLAGLITGVLAVLLKSKKEVLKKNKQLIEFDNIKLNFLRMISHEIRTPLNGIIGSIEILKDASDIKELQDTVNILDKSSERLETFLITALRITEINSWLSSSKRERLIIRREIEKIIQKESTLKGLKRINVELSCDNPDIQIEMNKDLFHTCISHIIINAMKHCTKKVQIKIKRMSDQSFICCEVIDDGPGFKQEILNELFTLFNSAKEHQDSELGLNYPLSRLICESHDGYISVENNAEGSARIKLFFKN